MGCGAKTRWVCDLKRGSVANVSDQDTESFSTRLAKVRERLKRRAAANYADAFAPIVPKAPHLFDTLAGGTSNVAPDDPNGVIVARSVKDIDQCKSYTIDPDDPFGVPWKSHENKLNAWKWHYAPAMVRNHREVEALLRAVSDDSRACLIGGALPKDLELAGSQLTSSHLRGWHPSVGAGGGDERYPILEREQYWLWGDIDGVPIPDHLSYERPHELAEWVVREVLPSCMRGKTAVVQFSASAGGKGKILRCHVVVRSTTPIRSRVWHNISRRLKDKCHAWDPATAIGIQLFLTSRPKLFDKSGSRVADPFGDDRIILVEGDGDVDLAPEIEAARKRAEAERAEFEQRREAAIRRYETTEGKAIVRNYARDWIRIGKTSLGDGPNEFGGWRKGYNGPIFAMACAAVKAGEFDVDRFCEFFVAFIEEIATDRGEWDHRSAGKPAKEYCHRRDVERLHANAVRAVLGADLEDLDLSSAGDS